MVAVKTARTFDEATIRPGDIVLTTIPWNAVSIGIRLATWSDFSHAILIVRSRA